MTRLPAGSALWANSCRYPVYDRAIPRAKGPVLVVDDTIEAPRDIDAIRNGRHPTGSKTRCKRQHDLTPDNVWVSRNGRRHCRACWKARTRQ